MAPPATTTRKRSTFSLRSALATSLAPFILGFALGGYVFDRATNPRPLVPASGLTTGP